MEGPRINDNGERVVGGSRRPDGTIRKERRVRAGYVPQEEQQTYVSTGVLARQGVPKCPGLDDSQASAAVASAKSKAAKKNEKRKAKKTEGTSGSTEAAQSSSVSLPSQAETAPAATATAAPKPAASAADSGAAALDKQIKALSKKVRQCQALVDRQSAGEALSQQEQEKVSKMASWQDEIKELEHQLAKMGV